MANYDILSETGYKRICSCANMVSDINVIIEDDSMTSDNTWSSQKIVKEILAVKQSLQQFIKEDDLNKIDVSVSNSMPSEDKMKENTLYVIKIFDEEDFTKVLYYKVYMKFGPNIAFLGDTNIGKDTMYTKEESDDNFLCAQVVELDNEKGLASGTLYRVFKQAIPVTIGTEDVYPILCDRKNSTHAEKHVVALQNWTDRLEGTVTYKIMNGICIVDFEITEKAYVSNQIEFDIINDGMLPPPATVFENVSPCTKLTTLTKSLNFNYGDHVKMFCWITPKGGVKLFGAGLYPHFHTVSDFVFRGSLAYPVM